jgi:hypothetical protein
MYIEVHLAPKRRSPKNELSQPLQLWLYTFVTGLTEPSLCKPSPAVRGLLLSNLVAGE